MRQNEAANKRRSVHRGRDVPLFPPEPADEMDARLPPPLRAEPGSYAPPPPRDGRSGFFAPGPLRPFTGGEAEPGARSSAISAVICRCRFHSALVRETTGQLDSLKGARSTQHSTQQRARSTEQHAARSRRNLPPVLRRLIVSVRSATITPSVRGGCRPLSRRHFLGVFCGPLPLQLPLCPPPLSLRHVGRCHPTCQSRRNLSKLTHPLKQKQIACKLTVRVCLLNHVCKLLHWRVTSWSLRLW